MSKSYKKAYVKDSPRNKKKSTEYWRRVRRVQSNVISQLKYDPTLEIPDEKTIVNDFDFQDYRFIIDKEDEHYEKHTRK